MMRKRLLLILGCLVSVLLAGYGTLRLTAPPQHRITEENIAAIKLGMTEKQVEAILGGPAGIYAFGAVTGHYPWPMHCSPPITGLDLAKETGGKGKEWVAKDISIFVLFDGEGRVRRTIEGRSEIGTDSFLDKIRRWLGM
jgi:hypothetical protein